MRSPALRYARANSGVLYRPDANDVLWFPGQDDAYSATVRDRSNLVSNHGTLTGTTWVKTGRGLWLQNFDGDDVITVADHATLDITDAITVRCVAYIDPAAVGLDGAISGIISKSDRATASKGFLLAFDDRAGAPNDNAIEWLGYAGAADQFLCNKDQAIMVAGLYHIVGTYDKDLGGTEEAKLYINAVKVATDNYANALGVNAFTVKIGANDNDAGGTKEHFVGQIGLELIRNKAWTPEQVAYDFAQIRPLIGV